MLDKLSNSGANLLGHILDRVLSIAHIHVTRLVADRDDFVPDGLQAQDEFATTAFFNELKLEAELALLLIQLLLGQLVFLL